MSRDDELLATVPAQAQELGAIAGYRHGHPIRRVIVALAAVMILAVGWLALRAGQPKRPSLPAESDPERRTRVLQWSDGRARLGLQRAAPGVQEIHLPDQILSLAPGSDEAQVLVDVRHGQTVTVDTLAGEITTRPAVPRSAPAPAATAN